MSKYQYTLTHATKGTLTIDSDGDEPKGWEDFQIEVKRDAPDSSVSGLSGMDTHGIFTSISTPLEFIGTGCTWLEDVYDTYGAEDEVTIKIEYKCEDTDTYSTVFEGNIDMTTYEKTIVGLEQGVSVSITDASFEQLLKNRLDTKVDILQRVSLDGTTMSAFSDFPHELITPSKVLRRSLAYLGENGNKQLISDSVGAINTQYFMKLPLFNANNDFTDQEVNNDSTIPEYFKVTVTERFFTLLDSGLDGNWKLEGTYDLDFKISINSPFSITNADARLRIAYGSSISSPSGTIDIDSGAMTIDGTGAFATINLSGTVDQYLALAVGSDVAVAIYVQVYNYTDDASLAGTLTGEYTAITDNDTTLYIDDQDVFSYTKIMRAHEALARCLQLITDTTDPLRSSLFGGQNTEPNTYASDGENMDYAITNGWLLRGYPSETSGIKDYKGLPISLKELFKGLDTYFNIGMGVEESSGTYRIRIEKKSYFYDSSQTALTLSNVDNVKLGYYSGFVFNEIQVQNKKIEREYTLFNDDFIVDNEYVIPSVKKSKKKLDLSTDLTASPYTIEYQRRFQYARGGRDGKSQDDANFIIALKQHRLYLTATQFISSTKKIKVKQTGDDIFTFLDTYASANTDVVVTGTASNNGTFTIVAIHDDSLNGDRTDIRIEVAEALTDETLEVPILLKDFLGVSTYDVNNYVPETSSEYDNVNNVLSKETLFNLRLSPARILQRWMNIISTFLQLPTDKNIKLTKNASNTNMETEFTSDTSDASYSNALLAEDATFTANDANGDNNTPIFTPGIITFTAPLGYDDYISLRTSNGTSGKLNIYHKIVVNLDDGTSLSGYLLELKYKLYEGQAGFKLIQI